MNKIGESDYRWVFVCQLYFGTAIWGSVQEFSQNSAVSVVIGWLVASAAIMWVALDAWRRGKPLPHIILFVTFLTWPFAVPIYLVGTRKLKGVGWALFHAVGLSLTFCVSYVVALYIVYGDEIFT